MMKVRILGVALLSLVAVVNATVLRVPEEYDNIQAAIDESNSGDTVLVSPGIYYEQLNFQGKAITVTSTDPCDAATVATTIIDGSESGQGSVVTFDQGEYQDTVLTGFTITGGSGTLYDFADAGQSLYWGAGIACLGSSPTVTHCRIINNHTIVYPSQGEVPGYAGGIACIESEAIIAYNVIAENSAYAVGAVFVVSGNSLIYNNLIYDNSAYVVGGVALFGGQLISNTLVDNTALGTADGLPSEGDYGNLYLVYNAGIEVRNNILTGAKKGGGVVVQGLLGEWFAFNDVWNNRPTDYVVLDSQTGRTVPGASMTGRYGNLGEDPLFAAAGSHNFHLDRLSPCIQAGDPAFSALVGEVDIDGDARIWNAVVDMGADEYPGCARPVANAGPDQRLYAQETTLTLDGSGSVTCDATATLHFTWTQMEGPAVVLSDSAAVRPTFAPPSDGRYRFRLVVSDGTYDSKPDEVVVCIGNSAPVANAGTDRLCQTPSQVRLDGSGSKDPEDDRLTYRWRQTDGPAVQLDDANSATPVFTLVEPGAYTFELTVGDGRLDSSPDAVRITTMAMSLTQRAVASGLSGSGYFHYPSLDAGRLVYCLGPDTNYTWDIVYRDLASGSQSQTYRSAGTGQDLDTQPRIQGDTIVWCGGPVYGNPWGNGPSNEGIYMAKVGATRVYTLRPYTMTRSYSHPTVWGTKVVWLEHADVDLADGKVTRWWNTPFSICGADITNPDKPVYFTVAQDVGSRDPYACYGYDSDFDHVIDLWGNTVVWEANGDIYGADLSDLGHIQVFPICTHAARQYDPAISGNTVVWTDLRSDTGDVYGADIRNPASIVEMPLVTAAGTQSQPALDGQLIAYVDGSAVKACRLVPGYGLTDLPLSGSTSGTAPAVSKGSIVWQTSSYGPLQGVSLSVAISMAAGPVENATTGQRYPCIQDAIALSTAGDWVVVHPGTYCEDVDLQGKAITLTSEDPTNGDVVRATVIHGAGTAVTCATNEGGQTIIQGLTLTGAKNGLLCSGSAPWVTQCAITGNSESGVVLRSRCAPLLDRCLITSNGAAGIESISQTMPGRGVSVGNTPVITHCLIAGNRTQGIKGDKPSVRNCTIVENGLEGISSATFNVTNSIIYFNGVSRVWPSGVGLGLTYTDVTGGAAGQGNIDADPAFVQQGRWVQHDPSKPATASDAGSVWVEGDYRLTAGSPAVDKGNPATVIGPDETDLSGQPRVMGAAVDMGAYEREG